MSACFLFLFVVLFVCCLDFVLVLLFLVFYFMFFFFSSRRRHTRWNCDWSSDVCSSDLLTGHAEIWHLIVLQAVAGITGAVSYPAFLGMVPILLPVEERKSAYVLISQRSEERRVGKECRSRWSRYDDKKKQNI